MLRKQQGFLTIITVFFIVIAAFMAVAIAYVMVTGSFATSNFQSANEALMLADSGMEDATHKLLTPTLTSRLGCSGGLTNTMGTGTYSVTFTGPYYVSSPTTLNGALTAAATTVTVASTANYQPSGRIMIDTELMNYSSVNATNFLNVQRGVDGSVATAHASGTRVGQYQCNLASVGGVPSVVFSNPGNPGGKRNISESVQLQDAWTVGQLLSSNFTLNHWNQPTNVAWNNDNQAGSYNLLGVSMTSNVDGWAVGASRTFLRWNGSTWATVTNAAPVNVTYNSVYCVSSNDCHAVGNLTTGGTRTVIIDWNGVSWTRASITNNANTALLSVHCDASNNCWAVGSGNTRFFQYTGVTGTWTGVTVSLTEQPYNAVFCNSSTDCWALGTSANVFARKNGASWASFTASGLPANGTYNSIYCVSSTDCWAVGDTNSSNNLIIHWDGTAWTRDTTALTPAANLNTVACYNTDDCWAAGAVSGTQPLYLHWNGSAWSRFTTSGLSNTAVNSMSLVKGPNSQPWAVWNEDFQ